MHQVKNSTLMQEFTQDRCHWIKRNKYRQFIIFQIKEAIKKNLSSRWMNICHIFHPTGMSSLKYVRINPEQLYQSTYGTIKTRVWSATASSLSTLLKTPVSLTITSQMAASKSQQRQLDLTESQKLDLNLLGVPSKPSWVFQIYRM